MPRAAEVHLVNGEVRAASGIGFPPSGGVYCELFTFVFHKTSVENLGSVFRSGGWIIISSWCFYPQVLPRFFGGNLSAAITPEFFDCQPFFVLSDLFSE